MMILYKISTILIAAFALPLFIIIGILYIITLSVLPHKKFIITNWTAKIILLLLGVRLVVNKSFPNDRPYFVMYNHTSFIDAFIFFSFAKGKFTGIAAQKNFNIPLFGWMAKKLNAIPIEKGNIASSLGSLKHAEDRLLEGYHICILPEGTRSLDGKLQPFKKGGFHMAINTNAPILPIGVIGGFQFKPRNRWYFIPGKVVVNIGDPIDTAGYNVEKIDDLVQITYKTIDALAKEGSKNVH
tara:strand:- start:608 stop:1330 length:723 start_codon:yes stop_codon:yes gene_type:complete